jgi:hypothetical protein
MAPETISGSTTQGQTLTVGHATWANSPTSFAYQWIRCDASGASCTAITGATAQAYTLGVADIGSTVRVAETGSNIFGSGAITSAATAVVQPLPPPPIPPPPPTASIIGTFGSGATVSIAIACQGVGGQICAISATAASRVNKQGRRIVPVTARTHPPPKMLTTVTAGVGHVTIPARQVGDLTVSLTATGMQLLEELFRVPATVSFTGMALSPIRVTFAFPTLLATLVAYNWTRFPTYTAVSSLTVSALPGGAKLALLWAGVGCPFARRTITSHRKHLSLTYLLADAKLAPGVTLEVEITERGFVGKALIFKIRRGRAPTVAASCLPPGSHKPVRCGL